jgi:hypothetical protein
VNKKQYQQYLKIKMKINVRNDVSSRDVIKRCIIFGNNKWTKKTQNNRTVSSFDESFLLNRLNVKEKANTQKFYV